MKKLVVLFLMFLTINLFSQEIDKSKALSKLKFSALAGINYSSLSGGSVIIEGKTNITPNLDIKLTLGYSTINRKEGYNVKTNSLVSFDNYHKYTTQSYNVDEIKYDVAPLSIGLEYFLLREIFSPYGLLELGYNLYSFHSVNSNYISGIAGEYDTFEELPSEYKSKAPVISEDESYRIAFGVGTNYKISSSINLDIRYVYQINKALINGSQILLGINF